ncbi:MAG: zinc-binding alcohol dehydrogenase [Deltaproteobacteria bacterium]|nr:zinc-binding alcohol dehydrogenase [Deltaproteobacteria bacterium]
MKKLSLYFKKPLVMELREQPVPEPASGQVLVATRLSAISAGTELLIFKGLFPEHMAVDATIASLSGPFHYPLAYGYNCVGHIVATGARVDPGWIGRQVFAFHPHESHFTAAPEDLLAIPQEVSMEDAVFLAGMETAVNLVMDGRPLIGEHVMVFGLGIIGLLTLALLTRYPLAHLSGVDRLALRRKTALALGADRVLDGTDQDGKAALATATADSHDDGKADLIFELTGNPGALNGALSWSGFDTRIVIGSWYGGKSAAIDLGGRFHRDRVRIASSQVSTIAPHLAGRWSHVRRLRTAWSMIEAIRPSALITHRFDITRAQSAYDLLAEASPDVLQAVLVYPHT